MCVGSLAGVTYLPGCDPTLSVHVMLVSRNVFHVVSALKSILSLHIFILADQVSCRSYIGSVYIVYAGGPLQFVTHSELVPIRGEKTSSTPTKKDISTS